MLRDLLRSRRRTRQAVTDRQRLAPLGVWHDGNSWLGTRTREHRPRNGSAIQGKQRREPEQSRYRMDTARPPPLATGPAKPSRLLRGHRGGVPAQPRTAGTPGALAPTPGRATRPIAPESRDGGIHRRRTAPRPERRRAAPARKKGDATGAGSQDKKKGFSNFFTSYDFCTGFSNFFTLYDFCTANTGLTHISNNEPSLPIWRCPTSETVFVG